MADLNLVILVGRLTEKPTLTYTQNGLAIAKFSIANNGIKKAPDGSYINDVHFFRITVMGKIAENCAQYLDKGRQVAITGKLVQNKWTDQQTQQTRSTIEIIARDVQFLGRKNDLDSANSIEEVIPSSNNPINSENNIHEENNNDVNLPMEDFESPIDDNDVPF